MLNISRYSCLVRGLHCEPASGPSSGKNYVRIWWFLRQAKNGHSVAVSRIL